MSKRKANNFFTTPNKSFRTGPPIGARVQNPFENIIIDEPLFPNLLTSGIPSFQESIQKEQKEKKQKMQNFNANNSDVDMDEAINILFNRAPKEFKEIFDFSGTTDGAIRKVLEPVGADAQCNRSGIYFKKGETVCWLCGCVIMEDGIAKACEHVIPALRAVMIKGLATTEIITNRLYDNVNDPDTLKIVTKNNYLWAHANCNGSAGKTNYVLITYDKDTRKFIPDDAKCAFLSSKIDKLPGRNCYHKTPVNYDGTNIVNSPYSAYLVEITYQCKSLNEEFAYFNGNLPTFCQYAINRAKLYLTKAGLEAMLTPQQKAEIARKKEEERNQAIQDEYYEISELFDLLKKDANLKISYLIDFFKLSNSSNSGKLTEYSPDDKMKYYRLSILYYISYLDLLSPSDDFSLIEATLNKLISNTEMNSMLFNLPLEIMLTIVYAVTIAQLYTTDPKRTIKLDTYLEFERRMTIQKRLMRFNKGSDYSDYINELYILPDGSGNLVALQKKICDLISIFAQQYIINRYKNDISLTEPSIIQDVKENNIVVSENLDDGIEMAITSKTEGDLRTLKDKYKNYLPSTIDNYLNELYDPKNGIMKTLKIVFYSMSIDIEPCDEIAKEDVRKYFTSTVEIGPTAELESSPKIYMTPEEEEEARELEREQPLDLSTSRKLLQDKIDRIVSSNPNAAVSFSEINVNDLDEEDIKEISARINIQYPKTFGGKHHTRKLKSKTHKRRAHQKAPKRQTKRPVKRLPNRSRKARKPIKTK
jgi:hypothetical protein